jgi:hypothetical protein
MKTIIAALALVLLAAGPTFAASPHTRHLQEGRASAYYVPQSGYVGITDTSRESLIHAAN